MPLAVTRHFGTIEYSPDAVIRFPSGLPAFEQEKEFLLIERPATRPLVFLQSIGAPEVCFVTLPVQVVEPAYEPSFLAEDLSALGLPPERTPRIGAEVQCLAIVTVSEDAMPTVNLLAPVLISPENRRGVQAVQAGTRYSHRHPLGAPKRGPEC